jgi:hypothetical protein
MLWEAIAYPYLLTAIFILLLTIADVGLLLFHFKTGIQSLKYICGFPGFSSSPVTDTFCPLDFASISFSSSLAYESEYCPGSNFSVMRFSTNVFPNDNSLASIFRELFNPPISSIGLISSRYFSWCRTRPIWYALNATSCSLSIRTTLPIAIFLVSSNS